ncbi:uncharacterized protein LOC134776277 [Penaeus indicus]|uniref:uncharacterized protein LOC134776277 n=1 Tax=Penaeus indicus TaxID=29960 RepID=UPI00300C5DD3
MNRRSRFEQLAECVPSFFLASDPGPSWRHSSPVTTPTTTLTATATRAACSTTAVTATTASTYVAIASTSSSSAYVAVASTSQGYASASTSLNCPTPGSSRAHLAPSPSTSACRLQLSPASSKGYGTITRARGVLSPTPTFVTATPSDASFQHVRFTTHRCIKVKVELLTKGYRPSRPRLQGQRAKVNDFTHSRRCTRKIMP